MEVIDAQVHAWEADTLAYPWDPAFGASGLPAELREWFASNFVSAEDLVLMMDAAGVTRALLTSPLVYGPDHRYAFDAARRYPGRFGVVAPFQPGAADVADRIERFRDQPAGIGVRVSVLPGGAEALAGRGFTRIFRAAEKAGLPVFVSPVDALADVSAIARSHPNMQIVLDQLGLMSFSRIGAERLEMLPHLLELAAFDNIAVKCSGAPELSRESYPYRDLWSLLRRVVDAFGTRRVMWGSDITQHLHRHTYNHAVDYVKQADVLSADEKEMVLGRSLQLLLGWPRVETGRGAAVGPTG